MGMRARLSDDNRCVNGNPVWGAAARLDDDIDCATLTPLGELPAPGADVPTGDADRYYACTILARQRVGYDDDGTPVFDWSPVTTKPAVMKMRRAETNSVSGTTSEQGFVTVAYDGPVNVFETAVVRREDGPMYRATAVAQTGTTVRLDVNRIEQRPDKPTTPPVVVQNPEDEVQNITINDGRLLFHLDDGRVIDAGAVPVAQFPEAPPEYTVHDGITGLTHIDGSIDMHVIPLFGDAEIVIDGGGDGDSLAVRVYTNGQRLAIADTIVTVDGWVILAHILGRWEVVTYPAESAPVDPGTLPDNTLPTAGVLDVAVTSTSATLTVTGAMDDRALDPAAYSYSIDGGATFTGWLSVPSYVFDGLQPAGSFVAVHRVRDAAGNVRTGGESPFNTPAAVAWTTVAQDNFDGDGPVAGRATTGGLTYSSIMFGSDLSGANTVGGRMVLDGEAGWTDPGVTIAGEPSAIRMTFDYTIQETAGGNSQGCAVLIKAFLVNGFRTTNANRTTAAWSDQWQWVETITAPLPTTGRMVVTHTHNKADATGTLTATVNDVTVFAASHGPGSNTAPNRAGFAVGGGLGAFKMFIDNLLIETQP